MADYNLKEKLEKIEKRHKKLKLGFYATTLVLGIISLYGVATGKIRWDPNHSEKRFAQVLTKADTNHDGLTTLEEQLVMYEEMGVTTKRSVSLAKKDLSKVERKVQTLINGQKAEYTGPIKPIHIMWKSTIDNYLNSE